MHRIVITYFIHKHVAKYDIFNLNNAKKVQFYKNKMCTNYLNYYRNTPQENIQNENSILNTPICTKSSMRSHTLSIDKLCNYVFLCDSQV